MKCTNCGHDNPPEARFCASCGTVVGSPIRCPTCGHENRPATSECAICRGALGPVGNVLGAAASAQPEPIAVSLYGPLPPRSLGELVNETFNIYRRNFTPFLLIALIGVAPQVVAAFMPGPGRGLFYLIGFLIELFGFAGIAWAVSNHYLGRSVTIGQCYAAATRNPGVLLLATLLLALVLLGSAILILVVVGLFLVFYFLTTMFFYTESVVIEKKAAVEALSRSIALVKGSWWRVFGIGVVFALILIAVSIALQIPAAIIGVAYEDLGTALGVIVTAFAAPIIAVGRTLVYFDLRVRKEGFTLDQLAREIG